MLAWRLIDLDELAEGGGGLVEDGDALGAEQVVEGFGRAAYPSKEPRAGGSAVEESAPEFPDGEVEGIGMKESPDIAMIEVKRGTGGGITSDIMVADQSALGLAGGA